MTYARLPETHCSKWLLICIFAFSVFSCSEKNDPGPQPDPSNLVEKNLRGTQTAAELKLLTQLSGRDIDPTLFNYDVDIYQVVYRTTYRDTEMHASGLVLLPKTTNAVNMLSYQHGTIVEKSDAPSLQSNTTLEMISYAALASMGFIIVVPDMIGFGESKDIFHPYYVEEPTATAVIDLLRAASDLADENEAEFNGRLFLAGYSQGGYATLATHKALEMEPVEGFDLIASFPGAGGYHLQAMQEYLFGLDTYPDPYYLAYVALSYQSYYDTDDLLTTFFSAPYADTIPSLFDGVKAKGDINKGLTGEIKKLVKAEAIENFDNDPAYQFLREKFEENSPINWRFVKPVILYHGDADITVPYSNSELTYTNLINSGTSSDIVQLITLPGEDHNSGVEPYIEDVIKRLQEFQ